MLEEDSTALHESDSYNNRPVRALSLAYLPYSLVRIRLGADLRGHSPPPLSEVSPMIRHREGKKAKDELDHLEPGPGELTSNEEGPKVTNTKHSTFS